MTTFDFTDSVRAAQQGDEEAFNLLHRKSFGVLRKETMKYLQMQSDQEDALQETYLKIYLKINTLKDPQKFLPWAKKITRRECLMMLRAKERHQGRDVVMPEISDEEAEGMDRITPADCRKEFNPEAMLEDKEVKRLMDEILQDLPDVRRACIQLWKEQYSTREIAEELKLAEGTVKSHVRYAKKEIENKVLDLEKQGVKLYSMAPLTFFVFLMDAFENQYSPGENAEYLYHRLMERIANGSAGSEAEPDIKPRGDRVDTETGKNPQADRMETRSDGKLQPEMETDSAGGTKRGASAHPRTDAAMKGKVPGKALLAGKTAATTMALRVAVVVLIVVDVIVGINLYRMQRSSASIPTAESTSESAAESVAQNTQPNPLTQMEDQSATALCDLLNLEYVGNHLETYGDQASITSGCVTAYAEDFDEDGEKEILAVVIDFDGTYHYGLQMYEYKNDTFEPADEVTYDFLSEQNGYVYGSEIFLSDHMCIIKRKSSYEVEEGVVEALIYQDGFQNMASSGEISGKGWMESATVLASLTASSTTGSAYDWSGIDEEHANLLCLTDGTNMVDDVIWGMDGESFLVPWYFEEYAGARSVSEDYGYEICALELWDETFATLCYVQTTEAYGAPIEDGYGYDGDFVIGDDTIVVQGDNAVNILGLAYQQKDRNLANIYSQFYADLELLRFTEVQAE